MALPKPSNASVVSETNSKTSKAASKQLEAEADVEASTELEASIVAKVYVQPGVDAVAELETSVVATPEEAVDYTIETEAVQAPAVQASPDDLASALMVPSIDKTAVIPEADTSIPSESPVTRERTRERMSVGSEPSVADRDDAEAAITPIEERRPAAPTASEDSTSPESVLEAEAVEGESVNYTVVRPNQTLWQIASAYRVSLDAIAAANGIATDASIHVGQELTIPVRDGMNRGPEFDVLADASEFTASRKDLEKAIDVRDFNGAANETAANPQADVSETVAYVAPLLNNGAHDRSTSPTAEDEHIAAASPGYSSLSLRLAPGFDHLAPQAEVAMVPSLLAPERDDVHHVAPGETLSSVANQYGVSLEALIALNAIADPNDLLPGQALILPHATTPVAAQPTHDVESQPGTTALTATAAMTVTAVTAAERQAVDYAANLRGDIDRLRSQSQFTALRDASAATTSGAAEVNTEANAESETVAMSTATFADRVIAPSPRPLHDTVAMAARVNPEFSGRDAVRHAAATAARSIRKSEASSNIPVSTPASEITAPAQPSSTPLPAVTAPAQLVANRDEDDAQTVAVAPLGSRNYAPVLPPRSVSPELPGLAAVSEYLPQPTAGTFDGYVWPAQGVLTSGYGWRWGRMHNGIDIGGPTGTPVIASAPGVVTYARWNSGGYGNLVEVTHPDGSLTLYAHNNRILVEEGEQVSQGQHIADMGSTGFSTGPHLHFELHSAHNGVVDPVAYLP